MFTVYPPLCKLITRFCLTSKAQGHKTNICYIPMSDLSTVRLQMQNDPSLLLKRWYWVSPFLFLAQQSSHLGPQPFGPQLQQQRWQGVTNHFHTLTARPGTLRWGRWGLCLEWHLTCRFQPQLDLTSYPAGVCPTQCLSWNLKPPSLTQGGWKEENVFFLCVVGFCL